MDDMDSGGTPVNFWDGVYQSNHNYYADPENPTRLAMIRYIGKEDTVLELGCGTGTMAGLIPNKFTGVDFSPTAIRLAKERYPDSEFKVVDTKDLPEKFKDNQFDVVIMRHFLENQEDWRKTVEEAFRICNKKVIINIRRKFSENPSGRLNNQNKGDVCWDINFGEFNLLCRQLSTNVSYGKVNGEELVVIGKHLDDVIFDLDDMSEEHNPMPTLLELKYRFPKLKVNLFCILSKCPDDWIKDIKDKCGDWIQFCLHGDLHDTEHGTAQETNFWTADQMNRYLDIAESKGLYAKVFRAPGWCYNWETVKVLAERGYIIAEHLAYDRWDEFGGKRYTTGHLMEVHGHTWACNMNGVEELATTKCNFGENTNFHFINDYVLGEQFYLPNRYQ